MSTLIVVQRYMSTYGPFLLTTLGIIGNILSILIFLSPRYRRQSSHFYLLSLALSDLCFLLINLLEDTLRNHHDLYQSRLNFLDRSSTLLCILVQYARNITRLLSSWIVVSFTIERLFVVFHPLKRAVVCRRKVARFIVLSLCLTSFPCNITVPFHYGIVDLATANSNDTICDILPKYRPIYMRFAIFTMISVYLLPMCIIGLVNMLICCKLWRKSLLIEEDENLEEIKERHRLFAPRHSSYLSEVLSFLHLPSRPSSLIERKSLEQEQEPHASFHQCQPNGPFSKTNSNPTQVNGSLVCAENRSRLSFPSFSRPSIDYRMQSKNSAASIKAYIQSRTHRITATLLLVSCSFLLLNTPYCVLWIANYIHGFENDRLKAIKEMTELLMLTNFCINFLLYCVSGTVFRSALTCLLRCRWRDLYDRIDGERIDRRIFRPRIEIQLNETKLKPRSSSPFLDYPQHRISFSSSKYRAPTS